MNSYTKWDEGDVCWDDPRLYENPQNLAYNACSDFDDAFDEYTPENAAAKSPTMPYANLNAIIDVIGKGNVSGYGPGTDIMAVIGGLIAPEAGYHFEFKFWKAK